MALAEALLKSVAEVFPECDATEAAVRLFGVMIKGNSVREDQFVRQCADLFAVNAEALQARREEGLFCVADSLTLLRDLDLRSKWEDPGFTQESKEHLWQYLLSLKTYAELYCALPSAVMGKIERIAGDIGERLRTGSLDLGSLNVSSIGNELLGQLSPDELKAFEGNLPKIYSSVSQVASAVAAQAGCANLDVEGLMATLVESQRSGGGEQNAASVLQAVGGLLAPGGGGCGQDLGQLMGLLQNLTGGDGLGGGAGMGRVLQQMQALAAPPPALKDARPKQAAGRSQKRR